MADDGDAGSGLETATFAGGCFWCTEAIFDRLRGVHSVESGYIGGHVDRPGYKQVCTGQTGHAEAVRIVFDPAVIPYAALADIFMATHDPTQLNRQGGDVGTQYRSAIFPHSAEQEAEARSALARAQADWQAPIVTTIEPEGPWWKAEDEHQEYYDRVGDRNPYCSAVVGPKVARFMQKYGGRLKQ
ncbi:MAG: peptide-methionine (S)-S-oxide reductase MsrA [Sandarakinorhabdus sp.]|nr:peptide-methionine (S)-S-oxide reductase MsrA [Sandarakinorhabdus sp.]MBS3961670.1 peptide-methionine (S)-S-oxide reductase MsrA [Sandarakinorhabdus sp.]